MIFYVESLSYLLFNEVNKIINYNEKNKLELIMKHDKKINQDEKGDYYPKPITEEIEAVDFMLVKDDLTGKPAIQVWDDDLAKLTAFEQLAALPAIYLAPLYEDFLKVAPGQVTLFMGYQTVTPEGTSVLIQNQNGLELVIQEPEQ